MGSFNPEKPVRKYHAIRSQKTFKSTLSFAIFPEPFRENGYLWKLPYINRAVRPFECVTLLPLSHSSTLRFFVAAARRSLALPFLYPFQKLNVFCASWKSRQKAPMHCVNHFQSLTNGSEKIRKVPDTFQSVTRFWIQAKNLARLLVVTYYAVLFRIFSSKSFTESLPVFINTMRRDQWSQFVFVHLERYSLIQYFMDKQNSWCILPKIENMTG